MHLPRSVSALPSALMLAQVIEIIAEDRQLEKPSVSYGAVNLYMHGPLEEMTKDNLSKVRCAVTLD